MSPRLALIIGAVFAFAFGLALAVTPDAMLGGFGLAAPETARILSRDLGVTLIGLGVINWIARGATGVGLRAILVGNVVVQALEIVVNGAEVVAGVLPVQAVGGVVLHVVLGAIFVLAMTRMR